jgi:cell division protein FtsZ
MLVLNIRNINHYNNNYKPILQSIYMEDILANEGFEPPKDVHNANAEIDRELEQILKQHSARIKVVGVGGGGGNTIARMYETGINGAEIIAINTDAQDLLNARANHKILIGREISKGLGAGSNPQVGREAAREQITDIKKKLSNSDMVFVTCGLGGGTGTGAAPVVAEAAKAMGALVIGIVTLPFTVEGAKRIENAMEGLERMESIVDTLIVIPNDKLLDLAQNLPLPTAFKISDEILTNAVKGITELITSSGLVNLDFADIKAVMANGGVSLIGMGESDSTNRVTEAVEKALNNPLLDVDVKNATGALVNVIGGNNLALEEYNTAVQMISEKLSPNARLISGAKISPDMDKGIKIMVIITGVKSPQMSGERIPAHQARKRDIENELGINFLDD